MAKKKVNAQTTPTVTAYEVRSKHTGAVVGRHALETDARRERDRLNDEARAQNVRHLGELMQYEVADPIEVVDELAAAEQRIAAIDTLLRAPQLPKGASIEGLESELEQAQLNLDAVKFNA